MSAFAAIVSELEREAATTERVLARIPEAQLTWRPHDKSMTLGQLAMHIATTPGGIAGILANDTFQIDPERFNNIPTASSSQELMEAHRQSVAKAVAFLSGLTAEQGAAAWKLMAGEQVMMTMPKVAAVRTLMLNHWYHHRGQMTVYLRLLNVPVPVVYGRSADENPFEMGASA
jgi:uncharacterized damage-inducible protein DinB